MASSKYSYEVGPSCDQSNPNFKKILLINVSGFTYLENGVFSILVSYSKKLRNELMSSNWNNIDSIANSMAISRQFDMKNIVQLVKISGVDYIRLTTNSNFQNDSPGIQNGNYISIPLNTVAN